MIVQAAPVGPNPTQTVCPACRTNITTSVQIENGTKTHLIAIGLCLIG